MIGNDIRGALDVILNDAALVGTDPLLSAQNIWFNDTPDDPPLDALFAVIRMEGWDLYNSRGTLARRMFTINVHAPRGKWVDHSVTSRPLKLIINTLINSQQVQGTDGTLTSCCLKGIGNDSTDEGYQTIFNGASFEAGCL